ncbi:MAG TPA: YbaK/EbsC family protein [Polyangia bacterium]
MAKEEKARDRTSEMLDATAYLDRAGVSYTWERHPRAKTAQELAKVLGISGYQVAKTVLIGADEGVWMAVLPAPEVVDLQKLATLLRVNVVRLLEEAEFTPLFPNCEVGAAPPFGKLFRVPTILDGDLAEEPEIVFRAGSHEETIRMRLRDYTRLEAPLIADFSVLPVTPSTKKPGMQVHDLMTRPAVTCWSTDVLSVPAQLMWDRDCGAIPVLDRHQNERVVGMITDRDICMATLTQDRPPRAIRVHEAMSRSIVTCGPNDTIAQAESLLREHQIRRLPVIDEQGRLLGILSLADLARLADRELSRPVRVVPPEELTDTLGGICQPRPANRPHPPDLRGS